MADDSAHLQHPATGTDPDVVGDVVVHEVDAALFDLDGTLVDSTAAVTRSWLRWAQECGLTPQQLLQARAHGRPAAEIVADLVPPERLEVSVRLIDDLELADVEGVVLLPGAERLVAGLPDDRWAVVTSCTAALAAVRIAASGLRPPPVLVTADDVERGKPDPAPYLLGARRLGVDPQRCLVVEDAPSGLASARAAGCLTLAVTTTHPADDLDADVVVASLADVRLSAVAAGLHLEAPAS